MKKRIKGNVSWIGYLDWELKHFHGEDYSIEHGSSQNAYLIEEEKTVLVDTVWLPHRFDFIENLKQEIDLTSIDYIVAHHGECDHSGALGALMQQIPDVPIYCTANAVKSLEGQYGKHNWNFHVVKSGDTLDIGNGKQLIFIEMPMMHWPDSLASFLTGDNILFSMDAFGQHFAVEELFNDRADQALLHYEALKYFVNILNPYAQNVKRKLAELDSLQLPIEIIAPSHGVVWRDNPMQIIADYALWADAYQEDMVCVCYGTMWNGTKELAHAIADEISRVSPQTNVVVHNVETDDKNDVMVDVFRSKALALGSPTVVNDILSGVSGWLTFLKSLKFKNKRAAAFGCYGWSGEGTRILQERLRDAGFNVSDTALRVNWNPQISDYAEIPAFVADLLEIDTTAPLQEQENSTMKKYVCDVCGYIYDPELGDPDGGIEPGTAFEDIPEDWVCPVCGVGKDMFSLYEE